jgi:hypothetical protein
MALGGAAEERTDCGMKSNRELFVLGKLLCPCFDFRSQTVHDTAFLYPQGDSRSAG